RMASFVRPPHVDAVHAVRFGGVPHLIESGELAPIHDISDSIEVPRELVGPATAAAESLPPAAPGTVALVLIAMVVVLTAVRLGAAFFIPLLLSLFLNYALSPTVHRLERWG